MIQTASLRMVLPLVGGACAAFLWALFEVLPPLISDARWLMLFVAIALSISATLLVSVGPLRLKRAAVYAVAFGLISGFLLFWSSWRFLDFNAAMDAFHPLVAFSLVVSLSIPFAIAGEIAPKGWRDYDALFDHAWSIFVRSLTAWAFTGLFWLVLFLSDALLSLVGVGLIGDLIAIRIVWMILTGGVLGLALAVLDEVKTVVSTMRRLALLLLRLLLPLVAIVVAVFVVLVPFQGLAKVFASFSAAATMLGMAAGGATLITAAVEGRDEDAASSKVMVLAARGLSLLLPVIVGIAVYAIWVRVAQYGWTPPRLLGALAALVMLSYGLCYAIAVLLGAGWQGHIRTANTYIALLIIGLGVLWLSPVLNAEKISANNHVARYLSGKITLGDLDLYKLGDDWGSAGLAALERLRQAENPPDAEALTTALAKFDEGQSEGEFAREKRKTSKVEKAAKLREVLPVQPEGAELPEGVLTFLPDYRLRQLQEACETPIAPDYPGCVAVVLRLDASDINDTVVFFIRKSGQARVEYFTMVPHRTAASFSQGGKPIMIGRASLDQDAAVLIKAILDGGVSISPVKFNAIEINGVQILPRR